MFVRAEDQVAERSQRRAARLARVIAHAEGMRLRHGALRGGISVDLFAGGGGWSVGYELATGRPIDVAINHDAAALAMHALNHPTTRHLVADVFEVDPHVACGGAPVDYLHGSPDCTDHSKAKGGKPIRIRKRRALAWVLKRWGAQVRPQVITLENVEEWWDWSPLVAKRDRCRCKRKTPAKATRRGACGACGATGRVVKHDKTVAAPGEVVPIEAQQLVRDQRRVGQTRRQFVRALEALGYVVERRERRACNAGAPTIRKRLYLIARCDHLPVVWPAATHGNPKSEAVKSGHLAPWRTAAECIDFTIPTFSIFGTREEAKAWGKLHKQAPPQRPLADATLRRTARGVMRFVVNNPEPFIVGVGGRMGQSAERGTGMPFQTVTGKGDSSVVEPVLAPFLGEHANASSQRSLAADEPLRTQCADVKGGHFSLVAPVLAHMTHHGDGRAHPVDGQMPTVTGAQRGEMAVVSPVLIPNNTNNAPQPADGQVPTVTSGGRIILADAQLAHLPRSERSHIARALADDGLDAPDAVSGFLVPRYGEREGQEPRCISLEGPGPVVVPTGNGGGLAAVHLATYHADKQPGDVRGSGAGEPLDTLDTSNRHAVIAAYLAQHNGGFYDETGGSGRPLDEPGGTVCAMGSPQGLTSAALLKLKGTSHDADPKDPLDTIAAGGTHHGLAAVHLAEMADAEWAAWLVATYPHATKVYGFLQKYYGAEVGQYHGLDEPMHTIPTVDRYGLVLVTVVVEGVRMVIVDIAMRMLQPRELYNAQSFPRSYMIGCWFFDKERGKWRWLTKTEQVRMCGNSVAPLEAKAIVGHNVPHLAVWGEEAAA